MILLKDKVAAITGAAAGIGASVAELFADHGASVFLSDVNGSEIEEKVASIKAKGGSAFGFAADVRNTSSMATVFQDAIFRFGRIDILVNNAGVYPRQAFLEMTEEQWDAVQEVNLKGTFHCTRLALPYMVRQRSGTIVNISSVVFHLGMKNLTHYAAAKGALIGFTRSLAREVGGYNVRVNCITPGAVKTEGERAVATKEQADSVIELQSLKRRIIPLDIARVCLFLSTELSDAMTGQTLNVDGGWIMY